MKSNILLTSLASLLVVSGANATEYKPFVGATMGFQGVSYSSEIEDAARDSSLNLPDNFFTFGLEGGIRYGAHSAIYNGGFTINVDTTTGSNIENKFTDAKFAEVKTFNMSATYDNYFRISGDKIKRIDLVLGAGVGTMNYDIDYKNNMIDDETVWSPMLAFKVGLDFEMTQNLTLSATTRLFTPTRSHYWMHSTYVFGGAIKYMF